MSIRDWPSAERPREKLLLLGPGALSEAELLALVIRVGNRGASAVDLAREVLKEFRSLRALLSADVGRFCQHPGLGPARYAELQAALELARRHYQEALQIGPGLNSPRATRDFLTARFRGTIDGASVHPREVVKQALARNAAAVILAHNHPSGVAEPSQADELITQRLKEALALVDIRLLDHVIVGDGSCLSFAEKGLI